MRGAMADENTRNFTVILKSTDIEQWKSEYGSIDGEVKAAEEKARALVARKSEVIKLLEAAATFDPSVNAWLKEQREREAPEDDTVTSAILTYLRTRGTVGATREKIKVRLSPPAQATIASNPNYLYTALKRLEARQQIVEFTPGQYRIK